LIFGPSILMLHRPFRFTPNKMKFFFDRVGKSQLGI
jgi:hypothetical protein